jgi:hypothetical protein
MPRRSWRASVWSMPTSATTVLAAARAARGVGQPATGARAQTSRLDMRGQQRCGRPTRQPQAGCNSGPRARTWRPWVVGQRNRAGPRPAAEGHPRLPLRIAPPDQGAGRPLGPEPQEVVLDRPDRPDTVRTLAAEQRGRVYPAARRGRADGRPPKAARSTASNKSPPTHRPSSPPVVPALAPWPSSGVAADDDGPPWD